MRRRLLTGALYALSLTVGVLALAYPFLVRAAGGATSPGQTSLLSVILVTLCLAVLLVELQGQAAGAKTVAAGPGVYIAALQGGLVSRNTAAQLSKADMQRALEAEYRALEAAPGGQPVVWQGQGVSGSVVAAAPYQVGSQNCRQYSHTLTSNGRDTATRGAACRNAEGAWEPLS